MKRLTWTTALPFLFNANRSIWPSQRAAARREFERMAKLADDRVEWLKQMALDHGGLDPSWITSPEQARRLAELQRNRDAKLVFKPGTAL